MKKCFNNLIAKIPNTGVDVYLVERAGRAGQVKFGFLSDSDHLQGRHVGFALPQFLHLGPLHLSNTHSNRVRNSSIIIKVFSFFFTQSVLFFLVVIVV